MEPLSDRPSASVLGIRLDRTDYEAASREIVDWARGGRSGYVCAVNVHMIMEAADDPAFRAVVNGSILSVPDGMPVVWAMRLLGCRDQTRVYGPTLMQHCLRRAERQGVSIGLFGGRETVLEKLMGNIKKYYPSIQINYAYSPPFGCDSETEKPSIIEQINAAKPGLLFVGLGCPKQEKWMAAHAGRVRSVMLGVGAAFDFHAGTLRMAPPLLQQAGLEWAFRLAVEPRRLLKRYAKHNPRFVVRFLGELLKKR